MCWGMKCGSIAEILMRVFQHVIAESVVCTTRERMNRAGWLPATQRETPETRSRPTAACWQSREAVVPAREGRAADENLRLVFATLPATHACGKGEGPLVLMHLRAPYLRVRPYVVGFSRYAC